MKTVVTVGIDSFARQEHFSFGYLVVANAAYFEADSSNIDQMSIVDSYSS